MRLHLFLITLLWVPTSRSDFICTTCEFGEIGNPVGFVTTPHGQTATCGALKDHIASLPLDACTSLQSMTGGPCGCTGFDATTLDDRSTLYDDGAILRPTPRAEYDSFVCSICANGKMGNPNGYTLSSTGQPISCQELHDTRESITSESACATVQSFSSIPCACGDAAATTITSTMIRNVIGGEGSRNSDSVLCSICGDGFITNPKGIVTNDRGQQKTCAELEANRNNIPANTCSSLQTSALEPCACDFDQLSVNSNEEYNGGSFICPICGDGRDMTNLSAVVLIREGQPEVLCGALKANAHKFSPDTCLNIQSVASETCGCIISEINSEEVNSTGLDNEIGEVLVQCSVCGNGEMTKPEGIVTTRQGKSARCDIIDENPKNISQRACANIQGLSRYPCGCVYPEPDTNILNEIVPFQCSVCNGGEITIPDGVVATLEGQAARCDVLEVNSNTIPEDACPQIQTIASKPCGCTTPKINVTDNSVNSTNEQASIGRDIDESLVCHVCGGPAQEIGLPGKTVATSLGMYTCYSVYGAGLIGAIAMDECKNVQTAVQQECGCFLDVPTASPSEPPFTCSVCGNGRIVTRPDGIIDGTNTTTCAQYEAVAAKGEISEDQCLVLQQVSGEGCGCKEAPAIPTAAPTSYECQPCGEGRMIGLPDAELILPNLQKMSCGDVQQRAEAGIIQDFQCTQIQPLVSEYCGCVDKPYTEAPEVFECQICGDGLRVTNPDGVVEIPTQPNRTCAELLDAAVMGHINPNQCFLLHPFVQAPCECISIYSDMPTDIPVSSPTAPTLSPAPTDVTMRGDCFSDLRDIQAMEREVEDTLIARKYILCPGRTFHMGVWTEDGEIKDGQPFLALRPNVIYQCGQDGSRTNNCVLKGGDFGLASYYEVIEGIYETVPGVEVRGLTFESQNLFSVLLKSAGDITFIGCAFKGNSNNAPVLIQWQGEESESDISLRVSSTGNQTLEEDDDDGELKQVVTFQDCVFRDNLVDDSISFPGIIENTFNSELIVTNCLFQENVYGSTNNPSTVGYAIRSFGPLTLDSSCFVNNVFLKHGPVLVYGAQYSALNNYVESSQIDLTCEFGALFSSQDDMTETIPTCEMSDANACGFSQGPTISPSVAPTQSPVVNDVEITDTESSVMSGTKTSDTSSIRIMSTYLFSLGVLCLSMFQL